MAAGALLLSLALLAADERSSPGFAAYQRANELFVKQRFSECKSALDEALRLDPKLAPALTLQAKLSLANNDFIAARASLERAIESAPANAYAHFLYGLQFFMQNDLQLAVAPLERARKLNPRDPRAPLYLGLTLESLGKNDEASSLYADAIRLEEAAGQLQASTLLIAARLLLLSERTEEGGALIQRAVKLEPASRDARFELARLLLSRKDAVGAAREAEAALRLEGGETGERQIRYLLVRAYQAAGQEAMAARHAEAIRAAESRK